MYDYQNKQTNSLLKHFDSDYPNKFWLAPAEIAMERFSDNDFDPIGSQTKKISEKSIRFQGIQWKMGYQQIPSDF